MVAVNEAIASLKEAKAAAYNEDFSHSMSAIEKRIESLDSPIEKIMACQLALMGNEENINHETTLHSKEVGSRGIEYCKCLHETGYSLSSIEYVENYITVFPQAKIANYRVDFLIFASRLEIISPDLSPVPPPHCTFIVECDGHNWHDKTKEQAARDKARDRVLQSHGPSVLRFTGSEIFNSPGRCLEEIENFLEARLDAIPQKTWEGTDVDG